MGVCVRNLYLKSDFKIKTKEVKDQQPSRHIHSMKQGNLDETGVAGVEESTKEIVTSTSKKEGCTRPSASLTALLTRSSWRTKGSPEVYLTDEIYKFRRAWKTSRKLSWQAR